MKNLLRKTGFLVLLVLFASPLLRAQYLSGTVEQEGSLSLQTQNEGFKPDVRVTLGSSFTSFGGGFTGFGTFVAPEISFPVTKKFSMEVGLGYSSYFYSTPGQSLFSQGNSQYGSIYVSGTYQASEKLRIRGTAYKTFLLNSGQPAIPGETVNPYALDFSNQGVILDVNYKVSENTSIGISFEYREQNYPAFYPYNTGGFGNGFGRSPFNNDPFARPGF